MNQSWIESCSYYAAGSVIPKARPPLTRRINCDVAVVGGGLFGISAALHLAERGLSVALLEASTLGSGASGRNGGQLLPGLARGLDDLIRAVGSENATALYRLTLDGADRVRHLIEKHGIECDFRPGAISAAARPGHVDLLRREADALHRLGHEGLRWLDRPEAERLTGTSRYFGGVLDGRAGHLNPLKFTFGLAAAAENAGALLFEGSKAQAIHWPERSSGDIEIVTALGGVQARHLILAGNASTGELVPALAVMIMPVITFMMATEPIDVPRFARCLPADVCVADTNFVLDYFRRSADRRIIWGGGVSYSARRGAGFARRLLGRFHAAYPALNDVGIAYSWSGVVDLTLNRLPQIGWYRDRAAFAQGFSGHGLILSIILGQVFAQAILGKTRGFDLFAGIPHRAFPGGPLFRRPFLVAAALYAQLRDHLSG